MSIKGFNKTVFSSSYCVIARVRVVLKTTVVGATNNNSFQNYNHPDDHTIRTTDTFGFKPFTIKQYSFTIIGYDSIEAWLNYYISNGGLTFHFFEVDFEKWALVFFHLFY